MKKILPDGSLILLLAIVTAGIGTVYLYNHLRFQNESNNSEEWTETVWKDKERKIEVVYDYPSLSAKLIATDGHGRKDVTETGYGVDDVTAVDYDRYRIMATGRESDRVVDFDFLQEVMFLENGPAIQTIVRGPAFGGYYGQNIVYIPEQSEVTKLELIVYPDDVWNFGREMVNRSDWNSEYWLVGVQLLDENEIIVEFGGECEGEGKPPVCARYLLSAPNRRITALPPPPSTALPRSIGDQVGSFVMTKFEQVSTEEDGYQEYYATFSGKGLVMGTLSYTEDMLPGWRFEADDHSMIPTAKIHNLYTTPWFMFDEASERFLSANYSTSTKYRQTIEITDYREIVRPTATADIAKIARVTSSEVSEEVE